MLLKPKHCSLRSHGFMFHELLLRMRTNVVYFRVMRRLCHREWNWLWNWRCVNQHSWDPWQRDTWSRRATSDFKGELWNRFNLILEERVKFCEQNSENLMKIGWKIRKLWHFEVSQIFTKHFLTSRYEYANEWVDDVITSQLDIYFVHKILKNSIFCAYLW